MAQDSTAHSKIRKTGIMAPALVCLGITLGLGAVFLYIFPGLDAYWKPALGLACLSVVLCLGTLFIWQNALQKRVNLAHSLLKTANSDQDFTAVGKLLTGLPFDANLQDMMEFARAKINENVALREELNTQLALMRQNFASRGNTIAWHQEAFDTFFNLVPIPLFQSTFDGRFLKTNDHFAALLGYNSSEHLQEEIWDIGKALFVAEYDRNLLMVELREDGLAQKDITLRTRSGDPLPVRIYAWELKDEDGGKIGQQGMVRDLRPAQEHARVIEALEKAENRNAAKTRFMSTLSHRLRSPLHTMLGILDLLDHKKVDPQLAEYVLLMERAGQTVVEITNDILDLSRLEMGMFNLEIAPFNIHAMVEDIRNKFAPQAEAHNLTLNCAVIGNLPQYFIGDRWRLGQIFTNLLDNAIKYTRSGTVEFTVERDPNQSSDLGTECLFFQVRDSGDGIPEDVQKHIFDEFYRGSNATEAGYDGAGLGLPICKKLVEAMGGTLAITSRPGEGTWVRFTLCLRCQAADQMFNTDEMLQRPAYVLENVIREDQTISGSIKDNIIYPAYTPKAAEPQPFELILVDDDSALEVNQEEKIQPMQILLAEDSPNNRLLFSLLIRDTQHQVVEAVNGEDAVVLFRSNNFDIVFMDMEMPLMDGFQATKLIRATERSDGRPHTPIVALTAYVLPGAEERCLEAGCDVYLPKPFNLPSILKLLETYGKPATKKTEPTAEDIFFNLRPN